MAVVKGHVEVFMPQRVADLGGRNSGAGSARRVAVAANAPSAHVFQTEFARKISQQMSRIVDADASPCAGDFRIALAPPLYRLWANPLTACAQ